MTNVEMLQRWLRADIPAVGINVGHFDFYVTLLAGLASRCVRGESVIAHAVLKGPDDETLIFVDALRTKRLPTQEERAFLKYFGSTEEVRAFLRECVAGVEGDAD